MSGKNKPESENKHSSSDVCDPTVMIFAEEN